MSPESEQLLESFVLAQEFAGAFGVVVEISGCDEFFKFVKTLLFLCDERAEIHEKAMAEKSAGSEAGSDKNRRGSVSETRNLSGEGRGTLNIQIKTVKAARGTFTV